MKENENNTIYDGMWGKMLSLAVDVYRSAYDVTGNRTTSQNMSINLYRKSGLFHLDQEVYENLTDDEINRLKNVSSYLRKLDPENREKVLQWYKRASFDHLTEYFYTDRATKLASSFRNSDNEKDQKLCKSLDRCADNIISKVDRPDDESVDSRVYELAKEGLIILTVTKKYIQHKLLEKGAVKVDIMQKKPISAEEKEKYNDLLRKVQNEMYWSNSGNYKVMLENWCMLLDEHKEKIIEFSEKLKQLPEDERIKVLNFIRRNINNKYETEEAAERRRLVIKGILDEDQDAERRRVMNKINEALEIFDDLCGRINDAFKGEGCDFDRFRMFDARGNWNIKFKYADFYNQVEDFYNDVERIQSILHSLNRDDLARALKSIDEKIALREKQCARVLVREEDEKPVDDDTTSERKLLNAIKDYQKKCIKIVKRYNGIIDKTILLEELQKTVNGDDFKRMIAISADMDIIEDNDIDKISIDENFKRTFARMIVQNVCDTVCLEWHNLVMTHAGYKRIVKIVTQIQAQQNAAQLGVDLDVGLRRWPNQWLEK